MRGSKTFLGECRWKEKEKHLEGKLIFSNNFHSVKQTNKQTTPQPHTDGKEEQKHN